MLGAGEVARSDRSVGRAADGEQPQRAGGAGEVRCRGAGTFDGLAHPIDPAVGLLGEPARVPEGVERLQDSLRFGV